MPDNTVEIKVVATGGSAAAQELAKPTQAIKEQTGATKELASAQKQLAELEGAKKAGVIIPNAAAETEAATQRVTNAQKAVAAEQAAASAAAGKVGLVEKLTIALRAEGIEWDKLTGQVQKALVESDPKNRWSIVQLQQQKIEENAARAAEVAARGAASAANSKPLETTEEDKLLEQKQGIATTMALAASEEAAGRTANAAALQLEAEELALCVRLQKTYNYSAAEAAVIAKQQVADERKIAELKAIEVASAKAEAAAEKEQAAATALRAKELESVAAKNKKLAQNVQTIGLSQSGLAGGSAAVKGIEGLFGVSALTVGITAAAGLAVAAIGGIMKRAEEAENNVRKLDAAWAQTRNDFGQQLHFASLEELPGLIQSVEGSISNLRTQMTEVSQVKMTAVDVIKEWITGVETAAEKLDRLSNMDDRHRLDITEALKEQAVLGREVLRIDELRANGQTREAEAAQAALNLEKEKQRIRNENKNAVGADAVGARRELEEQATKKAAAAEKKKNTERTENFAKEYEDAEQRLKQLEAQAGGNGPAARLAGIEKERLDTLHKITKELESGAITENQAAIRKKQTEDIANAEKRAVGQEQFRKDFEADKARHRETGQQASARRDKEKQDRAEDEAQIQRNITKQEAEMANGKWGKDDEGKPVYQPGRRMSDAEKEASRKAQRDAIKKDREPKKERHSDKDLNDIGAEPDKPKGDGMVPDASDFFKKAGRKPKPAPAPEDAGDGEAPDVQPVADAAGQGAQKVVQQVAAALAGGFGALNLAPITSALASIRADLKTMQAQIDAANSIH